MEYSKRVENIKYLDSRLLNTIIDVINKDYKPTGDVLSCINLCEVYPKINNGRYQDNTSIICDDGIYEYIALFLGLSKDLLIKDDKSKKIIDIYDYFNTFSNDELETIIDLYSDMIEEVYTDIINTCNYILFERSVYVHNQNDTVDYEYICDSINTFIELDSKKLIRK